jgi:hypothetical protein
MQFVQVTGKKVSYVELRCRQDDVKIQIEEDTYLEVDDEPFVCLNFKNKALGAFIVKSTELRSYVNNDRLSDFKGIDELRELRNSYVAITEDKQKSLFDKPVNKISPRKSSSVKWPTIISVALNFGECKPDVRLLGRRVRDNESVWVHMDDMGVIISFLKLKGLNINLKRSRHELPAGIQYRKKVKAGVEIDAYVVATKADDAVEYKQFASIEDAIAYSNCQVKA